MKDIPRVDRCYLHIGMMKTGTTSIQQAFRYYDDGRLRYLPTETHNHSRLLRATLKHHPSFDLRTLGTTNKADLNRTRSDLRRRFQASIDAADRPVIISSEELSTTYNRDEAVLLAQILKHRFNEIRLLAYVREPRSYMSSIFQQRLKTGRPDFDIDKLYPDYKRKFNKWIAAFGRESLEAVQFHRSCFRDADLIADFAHRVGAHITDINRPIGMLNESFTAEASAILFAYRRDRGHPKNRTMTTQFNGRAMVYLRTFGSHNFEIDRQLCDAAIDRRSDDIDFVETLMGSSFVHRPVDDRAALVVTSSSDLLELASELTTTFVQKVQADYGAPAAGVTSLYEAMDVVYSTRNPKAGEHPDERRN
jgi:hypothetical protein